MDFDNIDYEHIGFLPDVKARSIAMMPLIKELLKKETGYLSEENSTGYIERSYDKDVEVGHQFLEMLKNKGGRLFYKYIKSSGSLNILLWNNGAVELDVGNGYVNVNVFSYNEQFVTEIINYFKSKYITKQTDGHIYAIMRNGNSLVLNSIGNAGIPLEAGNYTPSVIEDYRYVIRDLQSSSPSGRITIMEGLPGSGKTFLIRAILTEVNDAMFVLVPPEMITTLGGPELLPLLMNYKHTKGPIVLVLEDADRCLVVRNNENMNTIQSLLNLGDGILGSLLDIRIVATTNASKLEMEEAILRPGRLSKRLEVGALDFNTAQQIFNRLLPEKTLPKELKSRKENAKISLAEVYSLARQHGWLPKPREIEVNDEEDFDD